MRTVFGVLVLFGSMLAGPRLAAAQPQLEEGAPALAQQRYVIGRTLYREGKLDEAAAEFRSALDLFPTSAKLAYNLGRTLERLGRLEEAVGYYRRYVELEPAGDDLGPLIAGLEKQIAERQPELVLSTTPVGAAVYLDSAKEPLADPTPLRVRVAAGPHVLRFTLPGHAERVEKVHLKLGESRALAIELERLEAPPAVTAAPPPPPAEPSSRWLAWSLVGAGAASAAVAGVFVWQASTAASDAEDVGPSYARRGERADLEDDFDSSTTGAWIAGGLAVPLVGAGLTLLFWPEDTVHIAPTADGVALGGRF
ncbi:MAG: tetratricopeptide repeat protein [Myxococcales bacterium]|nr:tetratricopeptide repeat protein [Myxococcales bacterium]